MRPSSTAWPGWPRSTASRGPTQGSPSTARRLGCSTGFRLASRGGSQCSGTYSQGQRSGATTSAPTAPPTSVPIRYLLGGPRVVCLRPTRLPPRAGSWYRTLSSQDSGPGGQLCHFARLCAAGSDRSKASDANKEPATAVEERNRGQIGGPIAQFELDRARTLPARSILSGTAGNLQDRAIAAIAAIAPGATSDERPTAKRGEPEILRRVGAASGLVQPMPDVGCSPRKTARSRTSRRNEGSEWGRSRRRGSRGREPPARRAERPGRRRCVRR
jgi:hypothetical protein